MKLPLNFFNSRRDSKLERSVEQLTEIHFLGQKGRIPKWHYFGPVSITEIHGDRVFRIKHRDKYISMEERPPEINKEEEDQMVKLLEAGLPKGEIARQMGISTPEVRRRLRAHFSPQSAHRDEEGEKGYLGNVEVRKEDENETIRVYHLRKAKGIVPRTIVSINQDLLAECEQVPFRQTVEGNRKAHVFEVVMLLIGTLALDVTSLFLSFTSSTPVATSRAALSYLYEPVALVIAFAIVGYIMHKVLLDRTFPKYMVLRDLPGQPTGRELATPVMLLNSQLEHPTVYLENISENYDSSSITGISNALAQYDETAQATLRSQNQMLEFDYHALELKTEKMSLEKQNLELTYPRTIQSRAWRFAIIGMAFALALSVLVNLGV